MFYPVDSLKRGGRFYLCWVADSWPLQFATLTHRQLMSQDIRSICDALIEVVKNESGRPANRFSLRLSSQLMRGVVRLYQRKVSILLNDLCMSNAYILKLANKKFVVHAPAEGRARRVLPAPPLNEQRVEEMLQNSCNVVANIQDITLREATIPEVQLPPNDNFGEENPDQALQGLDRTLEVMLHAAPHATVYDKSHEQAHDKTHDKTRHDLLMENISELNATTFRRSDGEGLLPVADFEKEIPEISYIPIPELPVPQEKVPELPPSAPAPPAPAEPEPMLLEELEEGEPRVRRRRRGLLVDRNIKLSSAYLRARIANPRVELRCQRGSDEIVSLQVPVGILFRRPARDPMALALTRMFQRNLGHINRTSAERDIMDHEAMRQMQPNLVQSALEPIQEEINGAIPPVQPENVNMSTINQDLTNINLNLTNVNLDLTNINQDMPLQDIANITKDLVDQPIDLELTQKIETLSQVRKRASKDDITGLSPSKMRRSTRRASQEQRRQDVDIEMPVAGEKHLVIPEIHVENAPENINMEADKENIPANMQSPMRRSARGPRSVEALLQEAGLADIPAPEVPREVPAAVQRTSGKGSEDETPLGSLDRTKVSLGDSDTTTASKRFIRDEWGPLGTMQKILKLMKKLGTMSVTFPALIAAGPLIPGCKTVIVARCFTCILKLKQHGFLRIIKKPDTLEIDEIRLGAKFD